jgi:hypothetical protein
VTRRRPTQETSLFDVEEPDRRKAAVEAAARHVRKGGAPGLPVVLDELPTAAADASRRWAERIAAARARIDHPEEPPDA